MEATSSVAVTIVNRASLQRRAAIEHIQLARQRLQFAAEELQDLEGGTATPSGLAVALRLSVLSEVLKDEVLRLDGRQPPERFTIVGRERVVAPARMEPKS
jgi:hypothetical protein